MTTPGERIRDRRLKKGLTQEELGRKARPRVAREAISKIEKGKLGVGENVGRRLARQLMLNGETVDDVLREILAPPPLTWQQRLEKLEDDFQALREQLS